MIPKKGKREESTEKRGVGRERESGELHNGDKNSRRPHCFLHSPNATSLLLISCFVCFKPE